MLNSIKARVLVVLAAVGVASLAVHQRGFALGAGFDGGVGLALDHEASESSDETHADERREELIRRAERVVRLRRSAFPDLKSDLSGPGVGEVLSGADLSALYVDGRPQATPPGMDVSRPSHPWTTHGPTAGRPPPA